MDSSLISTLNELRIAPRSNQLTTEVIMAKEILAQSSPSSAIHIVPEDGTATILNQDLAEHRTPRALLPFPREISPTKVQHLAMGSRANGPGKGAALSLVNPVTVLKELFELLEDYSPVWYTEESHDRAVAALSQVIR
jgi:hypothetical protein